MKLNQPKAITWWIAVILGVLGLLAEIITIPFLSTISFWLVFIALVLLVLATLIKGL